jgi:hypothetical protein
MACSVVCSSIVSPSLKCGFPKIVDTNFLPAVFYSVRERKFYGLVLYTIAMCNCMQLKFSLCHLRVLCVSVVNALFISTHHRDTEDTEMAQRVSSICYPL